MLNSALSVIVAGLLSTAVPVQDKSSYKISVPTTNTARSPKAIPSVIYVLLGNDTSKQTRLQTSLDATVSLTGPENNLIRLAAQEPSFNIQVEKNSWVNLPSTVITEAAYYRYAKCLPDLSRFTNRTRVTRAEDPILFDRLATALLKDRLKEEDLTKFLSPKNDGDLSIVPSLVGYVEIEGKRFEIQLNDVEPSRNGVSDDGYLQDLNVQPKPTTHMKFSPDNSKGTLDLGDSPDLDQIRVVRPGGKTGHYDLTTAATALKTVNDWLKEWKSQEQIKVQKPLPMGFEWGKPMRRENLSPSQNIQFRAQVMFGSAKGFDRKLDLDRVEFVPVRRAHWVGVAVPGKFVYTSLF